MVPDCKFTFHLSEDNLHLILTGDLNNESADRLFQILKTNCWIGTKVFIHTDRLNSIDTLDCDKINRPTNFLNNKNGRFIFMGRKARQLIDGLGLNPYLIKQ
jgi:hypothetical protein